MEEIPQENVITYLIGQEQAAKLCEYYNVEIEAIDTNEICTLLDKLIDEICD